MLQRKLIAVLACWLLALQICNTQMNLPDGISSTAASDGLQTDDDSSNGDSPDIGDVTVTPNSIDAPLSDILWCGDKNDNILILSEKGTVYHTIDFGKTWNKLQDQFIRAGRELVRSDDEVGTVMKMLPSPVDPQLMIFIGSGGVNWITEDCGNKISTFYSGNNIKEFEFHPFERDWLLASSYTTCEDFDDEPCTIFKELYVSQNLGQKWDFVSNYVIQFTWGVQDTRFAFHMPSQRIIIAHHLDKKGHQKGSGWTEEAEIAYSDDFFKSKTLILHQGNKFLVTPDFFFAVQVDDEDRQNVKLYIGEPAAVNYDLSPIQLPVRSNKSKRASNKLMEHSYTILDTTERQVFLHINHDGEASKFGNIYVSDSSGLRYSKSLHSNVRNLDGQCDFEKVAGLEGVYLANIYDPEMIKRTSSSSAKDREIPTSRQSSKPTKKVSPFKSDGGKRRDNSEDLEDFKRTMITFDKGGMWEPLKAPPTKDKDGNLIECDPEEDCALHLHSLSNARFGPFYSSESSLGIVLGTGNVGTHLSNKEDEINTYLSRNGGLSWYEIIKGSHIYEIGDHGAILVAAPDQEATKYVWYSWNEGLTWEKLQIYSKPVQVTNIIIEPSNTGEHFILYGRTASSAKSAFSAPKGIVLTLDFTTLHERACQLPKRPNTPESDYETYTPNGHISPDCLMGHKTTYVRRKRDAQCFNSETFDAWYSFSHCECTEEDWECDLGFERRGQGPCENQLEDEISYEPPEECNGQFYYVTQGYRKVAGNTCEGGVDHSPKKLPCPGKGFTIVNAMVLVILCSIIAAIVLLSNKGHINKAKELAKNIGTKAKSTTGAGFSKLGFKKMGQDEPGSLNDDDDDDDEFDNRLRFDDHDEPAQPLEDRNLMDVVKGGKKMAGRSALDTAQKSIPKVSQPGSSGNEIDLIEMK